MKAEDISPMRWLWWQPLKLICFVLWTPWIIKDVRRKGWRAVRDELLIIWKEHD